MAYSGPGAHAEGAWLAGADSHRPWGDDAWGCPPGSDAPALPASALRIHGALAGFRGRLPAGLASRSPILGWGTMGNAKRGWLWWL